MYHTCMKDVVDILSKYKLEANSENCMVECKEASNLVPKSMWETYSAFANTSGGCIFLGVRENEDKTYTVTGVSSTAKVQSDIWSILGNKNKVSLNILNDENISVVKDVSGKDVIIVQVPEAEDSQKPIYLNGKIDMAFVRKSEGDQKVDNDLLQAMLRNASSSVDSGMQKLYSINDIDPISLAAFKSIVSSRYEEKNYAGLSDMQFLTEISLFRTDRTDGLTYPTLGAILMLGKYNSIRELIPSFHLDYIDYRDTVERWSDRVASDEPSLREMNLYNFFFYCQ